MDKPDQFLGVCLPSYYRFQHGLEAFIRSGRNIVAQPEAASLHGSVKFVAVVSHVLIQIHDASVQFAHVLYVGFRHETSLDKFLQDTFCYSLGILDVTLASWQLLDEIGIYKFELH